MSRSVPASMTDAWRSPNKTGPNRPVVRATIQVQNLKRVAYDTALSQGGTFEHDRHRRAHFTTMIFGDVSHQQEFGNILSCSWERSVDQDTATCTITMLNSEMTAIGNPQTSDDEFEKPGWFTYNRGDQTIGENRWGFDEETGWNGIFVPDRVVRTYEGYGADRTVHPIDDPHLVQSGTWMIDKVTLGHDGTMTLEMRDLGRLLLDQVVFPPAIPMTEYPLTWSKLHTENVPSREAVGGEWKDNLRSIGDASSSNDAYVGKGFTDEPYGHYVGATGGVQGHHARHAIFPHGDEGENKELYWLSTGQDARRDFVWWQFDVEGDAIPVAALRLRMTGGPYRVYISIHNGTKWLGKKKVPWKRNGVAGTVGNVNINADIPFVTSVVGDRYWRQEYTLPRKYNAKKIRLTFTSLRDGKVAEHPWRAGLREFEIYTADNINDIGFEQGETLKVVGNYSDYTSIVKWVCAWAGWFWPPHSSGLDFVMNGDQEKEWVTYQSGDPALPKGRVWGDFMRAGTAGEADLTVDMFDKKPLMDVIGYVRDLLGYNFFIDETGGVVWRMPNLWSLGNYVSPEKMGKRARGGRTSQIVTLDEETTLLSYETHLDSKNIRERIFVGDAVGGVGTVIKGFNPYPIGLRRTAGWTDQKFETKREARVMADMISARAMFTYRTGQAVIPGYPKIQIDDQIRIMERVTNETFYHYVLGIKSELNMEEGEWNYTLQTHWLGERPQDAWVVQVEELDGATQQYLAAVGYEGESPTDRDDDWQPPINDDWEDHP